MKAHDISLTFPRVLMICSPSVALRARVHADVMHRFKRKRREGYDDDDEDDEDDDCGDSFVVEDSTEEDEEEGQEEGELGRNTQPKRKRTAMLVKALSKGLKLAKLALKKRKMGHGEKAETQRKKQSRVTGAESRVTGAEPDPAVPRTRTQGGKEQSMGTTSKLQPPSASSMQGSVPPVCVGFIHACSISSSACFITSHTYFIFILRVSSPVLRLS